ncbi:14 kDa phosphohistidine phosphatase-like isoform X2 [Lethenteron reissneri]|uniref:14 kDa phosphohistidine phosphatase-like isoform X2 n=1 Tax=Lethenteron reissneri TaxID=7753 RepID=UPI002AB6E3DC|nr:14 kDa phosphohistidine phosphatase-like isoform X2 [Lethenteron reissneri]XP_061431483.1 14 kDa phosphohistidine phosphatase-like isoform X2 [Lethenteron reissneri]
MSLSAVQDVEVSHDAIYKYVLVRVHAQDGAVHKDVVRGFPSAEFHADIYDKLSAEVERLGLDCECLGGGRIQHDSATKTIKGFGKADHSVTTEKLKAKYPDYTITHSDEGY